MKKRLRKKKHLGEFRQWGRQLVVIRSTREDADAFHDAFIAQAVEANDCYCGGSLSDDGLDVVVELGRTSDDPEAKFAKVAAWLDARPDVESWKAGPLFDLWHGDYEDIREESRPGADAPPPEAPEASESPSEEASDELSE